jgi:hypothetical protein
MVNSEWEQTTLKAAIAKAREAADIANAIEPRAESAYYDQSRDRVISNSPFFCKLNKNLLSSYIIFL